MTRQDFVAIAVIFAAQYHAAKQQESLTLRAYLVDQLDVMVQDLADHCQKTNPRFDRQRFLIASGYRR